jgi:hypothetical protein
MRPPDSTRTSRLGPGGTKHITFCNNKIFIASKMKKDVQKAFNTKKKALETVSYCAFLKRRLIGTC